jgi:hypothetical protein
MPVLSTAMTTLFFNRDFYVELHSFDTFEQRSIVGYFDACALEILCQVALYLSVGHAQYDVLHRRPVEQLVGKLERPPILAPVHPVNVVLPFIEDTMIKKKRAPINKFLVTLLPITIINILFTPPFRHNQKYIIDIYIYFVLVYRHLHDKLLSKFNTAT